MPETKKEKLDWRATLARDGIFPPSEEDESTPEERLRYIDAMDDLRLWAE